jgi:rhamnose utilization protein RhaD (predicted bifunctional aldolase and dehydrogenase)
MEVPMQDKCKGCSAEPSIAERDAQAEQAVMRLLLEDRGLFTFGEINKVAGQSVVITSDAIDRLTQGGMIHETGRYYFASRVAVISAELWSDGS